MARAALAALLAALALAAPAAAQAPKFEGFRGVLAQGEGDSATATDLAANQAFGTLPDHFTDQQPLYVGIMPAAASLVPADLDRFYRRTDFGTLANGTESTSSPKAGVTIVRDGFGIAHVDGATRADVMWGAGYAQAEERLFLMDVIRRTAKGTLAALLGPSQASGDAEQLTDQDFSDEELTAQYEALPAKFGILGQRAHADLKAYVEGINARIAEVRANPLIRPAEYAALGAQVEDWHVSDSAAAAVLLVTQFTVSNGGEETNAEMRHEFQRRFGKRWRRYYEDFRQAQDPGALVVAKKPYRSDDTGKPRRGANVMPDAGSQVPRDPLTDGPKPQEQAAIRERLPAWARSLQRFRKSLPPTMSNAVMVPRSHSATGRALAAMGPQVSYYSPQIFSEVELHGGGIDVWGVTFPGASPYPLIGHGIDFAWSGTSANGDNQDTFAERLCEPDGGKPSLKSRHYLYRGKCIPFVSRKQTTRTPVSPLDPTTPSQDVTLTTLRSVHGPVFAYATAGGEPIALAKAKAVDFQELDAVVPFMQLAENVPTSSRSFQQIMGEFPGTENWFYVDRDEVSFQQSGRYPRHAKGSDLDLPFDGDGSGDWQGFDPVKYTAKYIPASRRPRAFDPKDGFIISWNQKEAIGWRKGPREWSGGPVQDAWRLRSRLQAEFKRTNKKITLTDLTRSVNLAATTDLRAEAVLPQMLKVVGGGTGDRAALLGLLRAWVADGAQRLDRDGDNFYEHSPAVALFDAWWPLAVKAQFEPSTGERLYKALGRVGLSAGRWDQWGFVSHVYKDLRAVQGKRFKGRFRHAYCTASKPLALPAKRSRLKRLRSACQAALQRTLDQAAEDVRKRLGADPAGWRVPATCSGDTRCDQIEPTTAGAIATPAFPWQDRGTYHQVTEVLGRR